MSEQHREGAIDEKVALGEPEVSDTPWMRKLSLALAWSLSLGVILPIFIEVRDSFPYSTYPMFTSNRERVDLMVMLYSKNSADLLEGQRVPPAWIAGQEVMLAMATIKRATWGGPAGMRRLCADVRAQANKAGQEQIALAFVVESMNVKAYIDKQERPNPKRLHFLCPDAGGSL